MLTWSNLIRGRREQDCRAGANPLAWQSVNLGGEVPEHVRGGEERMIGIEHPEAVCPEGGGETLRVRFRLGLRLRLGPRVGMGLGL
jgi:hypothetical protein